MRIVAHRGNLYGRRPQRENEPSYLKEALDEGYEVETDIWLVDGELWLGHDEPEYRIYEEEEYDFILNNRKVWLHCKNIEALKHFQNIMTGFSNSFYIDKDDFVLTDDGTIWGTNAKCDIVVDANAKEYDPKRHGTKGVCTDYPVEFEENLKKNE